VQAAWDGEHGALTADDLGLLADLRLAVERGELSLAYQPQVHARTGRTASVESLLRWYSQRHGYVPPGRFIPLAERTGLVSRLTDWVICEALDAQCRWRSTGLDLPVSVNLSATVLTQRGLYEWILGELRRRRLPPDCLAVEVTETAVVDVPDAVQLLEPLRQAGVRVSIDDFGTGYTSLAALPHLPLSELKVDQRFVLRSVTSAADQAIVRTVRELAHRLGLVAVAEGVENAELCELMSDIGFDLLQGYHLARPMSEPDLLDYVGAAVTAFSRDHGPLTRQSAPTAVVDPPAARRG
jgi:EAL domain-containing protein (putative c-di-GMP-specific phosphodiesterase class I)